MNCEHFSQLIGMRCEPQPTRDGSACVAVVTPFSFHDGDGLSIFAFAQANTVLLSDEGMTLAWLHGVGHRVLDDRRTWRPLRAAVARYGVTLNDDGAIESLSSIDKAPLAFARMVSGLLAVDAWARDSAGSPAAALLREEAAMYLRAWRPQAAVVFDPEPVTGISASEHRFALLQGDEYIDAIGASQAAGAAEVRKLADIRASQRNAGLDIRVIVDDRRHPERAATELAIIGRFAKAWPMSKLIDAVHAPSATQ